jgi:hypothetical protein
VQVRVTAYHYDSEEQKNEKTKSVLKVEMIRCVSPEMQANARYPRFRRIALSFRANANHPGLHIQTRPERTSRLTLGLGFRGDGGGGHGGGCERGRLRRAMVARGERSSKKYLKVGGWLSLSFGWLAGCRTTIPPKQAASWRYTRRPLSLHIGPYPAQIESKG